MSNYLQRTKLIQLLAKDYNERTPQDISDIEYYMECLNPNFGSVEKEEKKKIIKEVCKCVSIECFKAGEVIYEHGSIADKYYFILEGEVDAYLYKEKCGLVLVNQVKIKESFGQKALIYNKPRIRTMIAQKDTVCGVLNANQFQNILKKHLSMLESQQIKFLWELGFLKKLDFKTVKMLHSSCSYEKYSINQYVYKEDIDPVSNVYIIKSGTFIIHKKIRTSIIDSDNQNEKQLQVGHYSQKPINKKICVMNSTELFGIEDIFRNAIKRSYSVQCQSTEGEVFVISKELFNIIIMNDPICSKKVNKIYKQCDKRLTTLIANKQIYLSQDLSTPKNKNDSPDQGSINRQEQISSIQSLFKKSLQLSESNIDIKDLQQSQEIKKEITDRQSNSTSGEDSTNLNKNEQKSSDINRSSFQSYKTAIYQQDYRKKYSLEPGSMIDERRKSQTPSQITKDLIDSLINKGKKNSKDFSSIGSPMLIAQYSFLDPKYDRDRIKSSILDGRFLKSESSFSDFDSEFQQRSQKIIDNQFSPKIRIDSDHMSKDEQRLSRSSFSLQVKQGINSLSHLPFEDDDGDTPKKKKSYIINSHNILTNYRESLEEVTSDDELESSKKPKEKFIYQGIQEEQIEETQKINGQQLKLIVQKQNQNGQQQILRGQTQEFNILINKQDQNSTRLNQQNLNTIDSKSQINETKDQKNEKEINTLRNVDEEEQIYQKFKINLQKQNAFVSCYSYLPSISTFFIKKTENPIDQMINTESNQKKLSKTGSNSRAQTPTNLRQIDVQSHQSLRRQRPQKNTPQNQTHDGTYEQQNLNQYKKNLKIITNSGNISITQNPIVNRSQTPQNDFPGSTTSLNSQGGNNNTNYQTVYYHNPRNIKRNSQPNQHRSSINIKQQILNNSTSQSQNYFPSIGSQNNIQSQQSLDQKQFINQGRSSSCEPKSKSMRNTFSPIKQTYQQQEQEKDLNQTIKKQQNQNGEKPKKEVLGVFNPNFFTSLKGKFITQFTNNPNIYKDIQQYKFQDFLKKHIHEGPLHDYIERNGSVESSAQKMKDLEDFKRQKKIVDDIATNAIESLKHFHKQQIKKIQSFHSTQDLKTTFTKSPTKLSSINISHQNAYQPLGSNSKRTSTNLINQANNMNDQQYFKIQTQEITNKIVHRNSSSQQLQRNLNQQIPQQATTMMHQLSRTPSQYGRRKKKQYNFILCSNGVSKQTNPIRLHSYNSSTRNQQQQQI